METFSTLVSSYGSIIFYSCVFSDANCDGLVCLRVSAFRAGSLDLEGVFFLTTAIDGFWLDLFRSRNTNYIHIVQFGETTFRAD